MVHNAQIGNRPMSGGMPGPLCAPAMPSRNCETEPGRQVQVSHQMQRLQSAISDNLNLTQQLADRLLPVTTNQPTTCGQSREEQHELVPLAGAIQSEVDRMEINNAILGGLLQRLEI